MSKKDEWIEKDKGCMVIGCGHKHKAMGYCQTHYNHAFDDRPGKVRAIDRLNARVNIKKIDKAGDES